MPAIYMAKYLAIILLLLSCSIAAEARKVKQSLKVTKENTSSKEAEKEKYGHELPADKESYVLLPDGRQALFCPDSVSFAGYEKEANASTESFLVINHTPTNLSAIKIKIIYTDLRDRMLHTRTLTQPCFIPAGETRKIDIKSWDKQHTYFYYLGNEPRKVATPYKTQILPSAFFIKD